MNISLKVLLASHIALLVAGFAVGFMVQNDPAVKDVETKVRYLSKTDLSLPKFNGPTLTPSERIYFLPGKTKTKRDTVLVPMPVSYSDDFLVSQRDPISRSGSELQFRYFDPQMDKQVIDTYDVQPSLWKFGTHLDIDSPLHAFRPKIGPRIVIGYRGIKFNISAGLDVLDPGASTITAGTSVRLFGNN